MKDKLKNIVQLAGIGFLMWLIVGAGFMELFGRSNKSIILAAVFVISAFIFIYLYKDKLG